LGVRVTGVNLTIDSIERAGEGTDAAKRGKEQEKGIRNNKRRWAERKRLLNA